MDAEELVTAEALWMAARARTYGCIPLLVAVGAGARHFNPLHHCVELVRHASFGWDPGADLLHLLALLVFVFVTWRVAAYAMQKKLVT